MFIPPGPTSCWMLRNAAARVSAVGRPAEPNLAVGTVSNTVIVIVFTVISLLLTPAVMGFNLLDTLRLAML